MISTAGARRVLMLHHEYAWKGVADGLEAVRRVRARVPALHLVGFGVKRIFVAVNYLADVIEDHLGDGSQLGAEVSYLREDAPLGTAGALGLLPEPPTEPILLLNGDIVTSADLGALLDAHVAGGFAATLGTRRYVHTVPFGSVERDGARVISIEEKPTLEREVSSGIYALDPSVVARVRRGQRVDAPAL